MSAHSDDVTRPAHYTALKPEPIEVIEAWGLGFCLGNTVKYIARAGRKPGEDLLKDMRKARWYLDREISTLEATLNAADSSKRS